MSGQYMMHGNVGSVEMLRTRPPALSACPDGVSSGYVGVCGFAFSVSGPSTPWPLGLCGAEAGFEARDGLGLREPGSE